MRAEQLLEKVKTIHEHMKRCFIFILFNFSPDYFSYAWVVFDQMRNYSCNGWSSQIHLFSYEHVHKLPACLYFRERDLKNLVISAVIITVGVSFNRFRNIEASLGSGFLSVTSSISHPECKLLPTSCAYENISSLPDVHYDYIPRVLVYASVTRYQTGDGS